MADNSTADSVARIFSLAALDAGQLDKTVTVAETVGGIQAGTVYPASTPLSTIIKDLLGEGQPEPVTLNIYYGATDNPPTSLDGLNIKSVSSTELVGTYQQKISAGNIETLTGQHPVFAVPNGYIVTKWCVVGFEMDIPHTLVTKDNYNIYYLNVPSYDVDEGGIDYLIKVEVDS